MSMNSTTTTKLSLLNINGTNKFAINSLLTYTQSTDLLLLTETWLTSPNKLDINQQQLRTYGIKYHPWAYVGKMGITLLVNPAYTHTVHHLQHTIDPEFQHYVLSFITNHTLIHFLYLPPSLDDDTALTIINSLPLHNPHTTNTIICGDVNARLRDTLGDHHTTPRGRLLEEWTRDNDIIIWNALHTKGQYTLIKYHGSSIVDWIMSTHAFDSLPSMTIRGDLSLGSDHKLIHFTFRTPPPPSTPTPQHQRLLWKLDRLTKQKYLDQYWHLFCTSSQQLYEELTIRDETFATLDDGQIYQQTIDDLNDDFNNTIYTSLDSSVGRRSPPPTQSTFWTTEMDEAVNQREHSYQRWRKSLGINNLTGGLSINVPGWS